MWYMNHHCHSEREGWVWEKTSSNNKLNRVIKTEGFRTRKVQKRVGVSDKKGAKTCFRTCQKSHLKSNWRVRVHNQHSCWVPAACSVVQGEKIDNRRGLGNKHAVRLAACSRSRYPGRSDESETHTTVQVGSPVFSHPQNTANTVLCKTGTVVKITAWRMEKAVENPL